MTRATTPPALATLIALLLAIAALAPPAWAQGRGKAADDEADADDTDDEGDEDDEAPARSRKAETSDEDASAKKQDLAGHDQSGDGAKKGENIFERDRFFVDKTDTSKTARGTLVQGSITSTTFAYRETGGPLATMDPINNPVPAASQFSRLFTDLRLQTDFRHIAASKWDMRIDMRGRVVNKPGIVTVSPRNYEPATPKTVQSGWQGENELEIKEAWILRNGVRSDVFVGRQFIADLAGVRIDGVRVDYASSAKFTLLGFGGLYPIRGSRSIATDYTTLMSNPDNDGVRTPAGEFTGAGGFGAAYRTANAYGSFGGVALVPLSSESPRVFGTSTGYWRYGSKLDFYHFAVVDVAGSNAGGLTNLSAGLNYKPDQRLRATLSVNRVDTETLTVQAQAFLASPDGGINAVQNEAYLQRIATNQARSSVSAALGELQRFEITAAASVRYRGEVTLSPPPQMSGTPPTPTTLSAATSAEIYGAITDRRSIANLRLGVDGSRSFGVGSATYQRTTSTAVRAFAGRELSGGHGEWDAEVAYASNHDDNVGVTCVDITTCYGSARSTILSLGGNLYYRINRDWFALGSAFVNRTSITREEGSDPVKDPAVTGLSGYFRIAYRF